MKILITALFLFLITPFSSKEVDKKRISYVQDMRPTIHQKVQLEKSKLELKNSELKVMIAELKD
jgi:hypothetical protein